MLTISGCQQRLGRLRALMNRNGIDLALITDQTNVYYYSGFLLNSLTRAVLAVTGDQAILVSGEEPAQCAASSVRTYPASSMATLRQDQAEHIAAKLKDVVSPAGHVGTELSSCDAHLRGEITGKLSDLEPDILYLRRRKDSDEIELIKKSVECIDACYRYARENIQPGLTELDLYNQMRTVAVETAGEPIGRYGNDFQCGTPGGPPRVRAAEEGELWILDLSVGYRGYAADASRAFSVGRSVTDEQQAAWACLRDVLADLEATIKPGVRCKTMHEDVKSKLDAYMPDSFFHHLGHGFGLFAHEAPHLNSNWDEAFEEGDTFTAEPGLYHESLRGGIRLENDYLVTASGVERLTQAPLEL